MFHRCSHSRDENCRMRKSLDGPAQALHSVDNALRLLSLFAEVRRLRITEVVSALGVSPATASRLVAMLEAHGYVQKDTKTRGYVVGRRLGQIGYAAVQEYDVGAQVAPWLESLAAETGETAQFGVLQGSTVVFVGCVEGRQQQRIASRVGVLLPAHALSTGKMLLATLPPDQWPRYMPTTGCRVSHAARSIAGADSSPRSSACAGPASPRRWVKAKTASFRSRLP
jgi:DNA-binding IclR family transcriptional regulator